LTPTKNFAGPFGSPRVSKCKEKTHSKGGKIHQHSTLYLSKQQSTQTGCYTIAACFPFEPLEKCMTFKDIFPGLSRTLSFNFQL